MEQNIFEQKKSKPELPLYSRVYSFGAGMSENIYAIISEPDENNSQKMVSMVDFGSDSYFGCFAKIDSYNRPISKKFGIGFYWDDKNPEFRFDEKKVKEAVLRAQEIEKKRKNLQIEIEAKNKKEREELPSRFPELTVNEKSDKNVTKQNLVALLKKNFPGIKFSVKKEDYSTYNVSWKNGPSIKSVKSITGKFEDSENSMCGDFRDYSPTNFNFVFGGFKYIFEKREITEDILFLKNDIENPGGYSGMQEEILHKIISETEIPVNYNSVKLEKKTDYTGPLEKAYHIIFENANKSDETKNEDSEKLKILKYSEKSIVVTGNTFPVKDVLKNAGGKFNNFLSCGPGWIFPITQLEDVKQILIDLKTKNHERNI